MADALSLDLSPEMGAGSTPVTGTLKLRIKMNNLNFDEFCKIFNDRIDNGVWSLTLERFGKAFVLQAEFGLYVGRIDKRSGMNNKEMQGWYYDNWPKIFIGDWRNDFEGTLESIKNNIDSLEF